MDNDKNEEPLRIAHIVMAIAFIVGELKNLGLDFTDAAIAMRVGAVMIERLYPQCQDMDAEQLEAYSQSITPEILLLIKTEIAKAAD